ncbi:MAG: phytase [Pseudomonadota bacterium]
MRRWIMALGALAGAGCATVETVPVPALVETAPVASLEDAADDPAIWVHPYAAGASRILGTDKQSGLAVYDLEGRQAQFLAVGPVNNVDLRQAPADSGAPFDVAVATHDGDHAISVFLIDRETGEVRRDKAIPTEKLDPYGICLGESADQAGLLVGVTYRDGATQIWPLSFGDDGVVAGDPRVVSLASQLEGCVFDEAHARLFIGEEEHGVWSLDLSDPTSRPQLVDSIAAGNGLAVDVEGVSIWRGADGAGWLVASAQGKDRFVVYERAAPHAVRGVFTVAGGEGVDAVSHTDGIDITSAPLGEAFPRGLLVVQDDVNSDPDAPQNFKLIDWREVEAALGLERLEAE